MDILFVELFYIHLELEHGTIITTQLTASNLQATAPLTPSTPLVCDSTVSFPSSTQGRRTTAIVPSSVFPGVDVVIYETMGNQQ
jgi:hypothetical protein